MDSDCLIKLTKAGAKEAVLRAIRVDIPYRVKKETVDEVRGRGYQDTLIIQKNIEKKALHVVRRRKKGFSDLPATKGEMDVAALYSRGGYDAIASDDRRFLNKLEAAQIPFLTPTACIVYLWKDGKAPKSRALALLERMKPLISGEEYRIAKFYLERKP